MTTQLTAVPPAAPATFRERAMQALETHQGLDLVSFLAMVHDQELAEAAEQAVAARTHLAAVAASASVDQQMLANVLSTVVPMMRTSAENHARAVHFTSIVESVRTLANQSDANGTSVDVDQVRQLLNQAPAPAPFRPQVLSFVPSSQFSVGQFRHRTTHVEWHLPFSGYSLCAEAPDQPANTYAAFLIKGTVRPLPMLYSEHGLVLEHVE